jgi:hypothetical protein
MSDLMNALLDATLDDIADLPEFKNYPIGAHKVLATFTTKQIAGKDAIELSFKYQECMGLADENDAAPAAGDTCSTMFMLDNEFGQGNFKKCAKPFAEALGFRTLRDIIEGVKDVECVILTGLRADKNDKEKLYMQVKEIQVV